jgi:SAM-dependent methyltransferase
MLTRSEKILHCIDVATQVGAEIGPLDRPIVTRSMGQIRYVDHDTTEALRAKYADPANQVVLHNIVEVDYVWGKKSMVELFEPEAPLDYVIASHVIEHVPNLIGWLYELRAILKPGGILSLAIPDKRQCFDYNRQLTQAADVIDAYLFDRKMPTPRQIFDYLSSAVNLRGNIAWDGPTNRAELAHCHSIEESWNATKDAFTSGNYSDAHCWVFTPVSFFQLLRDLTALKLLQFEVAHFYNTEGCEFLVSLRATATPDPTKLTSLIEALVSETLPVSVETGAISKQLQSAQQQIIAMETSKFWKIRNVWLKVKRKLRFSVH